MSVRRNVFERGTYKINIIQSKNELKFNKIQSKNYAVFDKKQSNNDVQQTVLVSVR